MGVGALGIVLAKLFGDPTGLLGEFLAGQLVDHCRANDPNAMVVSFKDYSKALQPQDAIEPKYKRDVYFYTKVNYHGVESPAYTYYEIKSPT